MEKDITPEFSQLFNKISEKHKKFFRWFGNGDVCSLALWGSILRIAYRYPNTLFWLPTQSKGIITRLRPANLIVREGALRINDEAPEGGSTVIHNKIPKGHYTCPGGCVENNCRVCWKNPNIRVAYPLHGSAALWAKFNKREK